MDESSPLTSARVPDAALESGALKMTEIRAAVRARIFTIYGTVLYVDIGSGKLRHGAPGLSPSNAILLSDFSKAQIVYLTADLAEPIAHESDACRIISTLSCSAAATATTALEIVALGESMIAFRAQGVFLCAEPDGRITFSRTEAREWESFRLHTVDGENALARTRDIIEDAIALADAGHIEAAATLFAGLAHTGGDGNKTWYAWWQYARCLRDLNYREQFISAALKAFRLRPFEDAPLRDVVLYSISESRRLKPAFDGVLILSPDVPSGGPEALHQLAFAIGEHGGDARMVYTGPRSKFSIEHGSVCCALDEFTPVLQTYARYRPRPLSGRVPEGNNLVVFPEIFTEQAMDTTLLSASTVAIWWLSVDNAFHGNPKLQDAGHRSKLFSGQIMHFYQSEYAHKFLSDNGATVMFPLFDYLSDEFQYWRLLGSRGRDDEAPSRSIAFFPMKGRDLARRFQQLSQEAGEDFEFIAIENMSKAEVRSALSRAGIYIDFGHHPGRDRVPREAAMMGAVVMLHEVGAARFYEDHPLSPDYRFTIDDINDGRLVAQVRAILAERSRHLERQRYYRQRILSDKEEFYLQVRSLFFEG